MNGLADVERLLATIDETADPNVRSAARDLVQSLMDFHGAAVSRIMALVDSTTAQAIGRDETARPLLLLYGLHPESTEVRVRRAVDRIRNAECTSVGDGEVRIRITGHGAPPTREAIEAAVLEAAPEIMSVVIEGPPTADFVPVERLFAV